MKTLALILTTFLFAASAQAACNPAKMKGNWTGYFPTQGGGMTYCQFALDKSGNATGLCANGFFQDIALQLQYTLTGKVGLIHLFCEGLSTFSLSNGVSFKSWVSMNRTNDALTGMFEDNAGNVGTFSAFKR